MFLRHGIFRDGKLHEEKRQENLGGLSDFGFETWVAPNVLMKSDESWFIVKHGESERFLRAFGAVRH